MRERVVTTDSPDATRALGARLGRALRDIAAQAPLTVALSGELGAGKTTFVGGVLRSMGVTGPVRSPTYTLIEPYEGLSGCNVYHLDLYRLEQAEDLEMLALRDLLQPGSILLVEWAERGAGALPEPDMRIVIRYPLTAESMSMNLREVAIRACSEIGETLANKLVAESC